MLLIAFPRLIKAIFMVFNNNMPKKVFLSIGDISASNYMHEILKEGFKGFKLWGITDEKLESLGVESVGSISQISVVGITEVIPKILQIRKIYIRALEKLRECDILIACDAPGFNLKLIRESRRVGVKKVIYFISPQVWAWKPKRAEIIAEYADHLVVILPFEADIYKKYISPRFRVHYVGHPLVDMVKPSIDEEEFRRMFGIKESLINLMPGSRWSEIKKHTPLLREFVKILISRGNIEFVVPTFKEFKEFISVNFEGLPVKVITHEDIKTPSYDAMFHSKLSVIASGTSSLEASLALNPHIVFYKVNPITYALGKVLVKVPYISLPNIILNEPVVPELINRRAGDIAETILTFLKNEDILKNQREKFRSLREKLGEDGVIKRLRNLFLELLS